MAFEMPVDQIKQLQILLRKEANLSWYQPEKEENLALPKLPSVAETVAKLDPSPPYLRCKNCNGRLLRGVQSFICVFCGTNPHTDLPPEPIKFKNTLGYRWLLESLNLDGSEMVAPMGEENASHRGRSESKDEIPLSELLDLEIRWPSEAERRLSSNSVSAGFPGKSSLNLAGVDLDSFFDRKESDPDVSEQTLASGGKVAAASDNTFQANENLSLFQNAQASEASAEDQDEDSFSGWEANFKSASAGPVHEESKSVDHSKVELDAVSGYWKDSVGVRQNDDFNPSASSENDWFEGGEWRTSNSEVHSQSGKSETTVDLSHTKTAEIDNGSSTRNLDWMQDSQWQGSENKTPDIVATDEADDSFDAWKDFTGSVSTQDPSGIISSSKITDQTGKSGFSADLNDTKTAEGANNSFNRDFDSNITDQIGKSGFSADLNDTKAAEDANSSSNKDFDRMQDDQWQDNNSKIIDNISTKEAADSFDAWNDFTGSATTSHGVSSSEITGQSGKFELTKDPNDTKTAESAISSSSNFDWMQNDQWQGSNYKVTGIVTTNEDTDSFDTWNDFTGASAISQNPSTSVSHSDITGQTGISEITADLNDTKTAEGANASSVKSFDWMQNDQWQVSDSKRTDTATTNDIADSFDVWSGLTSLTTTQDPFSNVPKQTVNQSHSENKTPDIVATDEAADSFDAWNDFTGSATTSHGVSNSEVTGQSGKFELTKDPNDTKTAESATSSSSNIDWMQNDQWQGNNNKATGIETTNEVTDSFDEWNDFTGSAISQNPSSSVSHSDITGQTGISEITADLNDTKTAAGANASSVKSFDWMQNDQWQVSDNKTTDIATTNDIADSFDVWSDFTSLTTTQDPFSNVPKQTVNQTHSEKAFEMNLFSSSNNSHDMDFSGFSQHNFSEQFNNPPSTPAATTAQPAAASLNGCLDILVADVDTTRGSPRDVPTAEVGSKDDVEMLVSQMPDLSFMLENTLSFPPK